MKKKNNVNGLHEKGIELLSKLAGSLLTTIYYHWFYIQIELLIGLIQTMNSGLKYGKTMASNGHNWPLQPSSQYNFLASHIIHV